MNYATVYPRPKSRASHLVSPTFDNLLNELFQSGVNEIRKHHGFARPATNVMENANSFRLELSVPGWKKENIEINIDKNVLTISGKRETESVEGEKYLRQGFGYNSFKRTFQLPKTVDQREISASIVDGILVLTLAKKEEAKEQAPRAIKVQ